MTVNTVKRRKFKIRKIELDSVVRPKSNVNPSKKLYTLLAVLAAVGVFIGTYSYSPSAAVKIPTQTDILTVFLSSLAVISIYLLVMFLAGLSCIGQPIGMLACIFKGMGTGFLSAQILSNAPAQIDFQAALNIIPFEAAGMVTVIFAARECLRMSALISERSFGKTNPQAASDDSLRLYLAKFALIMLMGIGAAAADVLFTIV